jgi:PAS domain S-box-containing protein
MRPDKTFEYLNPRFIEIFGYTSEDIPDKSIWFEKAYPDKGYSDMVISVWKQYFAEDFDGGQIEPNIFKVRCKDGQDKIIHFRNVISSDGRHFLTYQDITAQAKAEEALRERETELKIKTNSLEEMNTALRVLLERRDADKTELEEKVLVNVKELVVPFLEKVKKTPLDPRQVSYIDILESNLNDIISPFIRNLSSKYVNLTPTEIRVAHLIREGKTTKEIGEVMGLSPRTIETHRKNMRKKFGIEKKRGNLRSHLLILQ